ncbi:DNA ligase D [Xanthomonas phaseoli]|uniref:DNA ligase (ATP) n=1 Tax=Xanthomonas phaseoli pv. dieffenbachiae TaxID=92828 RepID=A0A1V9HGH1_9XANT|nr:DNA ligase D [Xanthomonas phaseoli]MBO9788886.1 DNA ligase D [Xanthomonas phaseoli pv. dieffenbachiae]MBO9887389.1 DNA ligase D [Xanthomonas phaseoli pv. dieffenbachiae]MBO9916329.1 DNA ligase D [Xanthomonas phaseoli pv. dieffenbachiae]MBO9937485.1 DNA ligase D [Xanthomonas phaseoli pv. dieffenbachiae]MBO9996046.1 DNA ligase D [Xanthomonas phaseoli pv. dieffenbachiae]
MSLSEYRRKRSFDKTREPEPGKALPPGQRAIFVVQLHHASRRHYDFRLQLGDALKSWAVPKGPSYDPKVKRMAVEVEDHPVDYASFEGEIPKGEYGGGHVAQFDHGVWATAGDPEAQLAKGHLRFELFGNKLKGGWHLVRSGKPARQPQWLLFKEDDAYAGTLEADDLLADVAAAPADDVRRAGAGKTQRKALTTVPEPVAKKRGTWAKQALALSNARRAEMEDAPFAPQLAKLGQSPPEGTQWLHEIKWDGYRILATVTDGKVRLWSRNALEWTDKTPEIADAIQSLGLRSAQLDGELIAGRGTKDDFNLLQATLSGECQVPLALAVFDLLHVDGVDISEAPLRERKQLLQQVLEAAPNTHLAYSSHVEGDGTEAFRVAGEQHFEGIISKRADRPYRDGRSDDWRKTKQLASQDYAVVGYTAPKGSRSGFGSLLLATPDPVHGWLYVGRVGSGFSDDLMREVIRQLEGGGRKPTAHIPTEDTDLRGATWFAPRFVVEVFYRGIGGQQLLRQASFKALRPDKRIADLADSDAGAGPAASSSAKRAANKRAAKDAATQAPKRAATRATAPARKSAVATPSSAALPTLSSPTKLIYPDIRATKRDVWDYYQAVMDHLLPQIVGRPLSIIRCPSGAEKPCFFQKHHTAGLERVSSVKLTEETGTNAYYLVVEDAPGLLELVQFNALEFHPWGSHADRPDVADRVVFDLDPGPDVPFAEVKRAANDIRKLLAQLELESFLRVSGGKGLHVVVPLNPGCDWEVTKRFAKGFADALAQAEPQRFIATATKRLRNKRIFVDYLRNGRGATAVASYSLRGRPGAPVALPLAWSDLSKLQRADAFTLRDVPEKLRRRRKDPWADMDRIRQNLARWAEQDEE